MMTILQRRGSTTKAPSRRRAVKDAAEMFAALQKVDALMKDIHTIATQLPQNAAWWKYLIPGKISRDRLKLIADMTRDGSG